MNSEFGNACAMRMVEAPCPQPTSATRAPRSSFACTPSSARIHEEMRLAAYPGRKNRSVPASRSWWCSCHPTPSPLWNARSIFSSSLIAAVATWNAPGPDRSLRPLRPSGKIGGQAAAMLRVSEERERPARGAGTRPAGASAAPLGVAGPVSHLSVARLQRQLGNRALCRVLARDPKPPMPLKERPEPPSPLPGLPLMEKRDRFEKETHSRINQALNAFTDAAKSHAEAMKSKAKADADFAAIVLDIFFGVTAPVFASYIMAGNGLLKRAAGKIAE